MRAEVVAREARAMVLLSVLVNADNSDWEELIGFETCLPSLPPRPPTWRARRKYRTTFTANKVSAES